MQKCDQEKIHVAAESIVFVFGVWLPFSGLIFVNFQLEGALDMKER